MRAFSVVLALAAAVVAQDPSAAPVDPAAAPVVPAVVPQSESLAAFQSTYSPEQDPSRADWPTLPYLESLPYPWFQQQGYQEVGCGYGHIRNSEGHCLPAAWYTVQGCYETTIIHQTVIAAAPAHTVTMTETCVSSLAEAVANPAPRLVPRRSLTPLP